MRSLDYLPLYVGVLALQLVTVASAAFGRLPAGWSWPFLMAWGAALAAALVVGYRARYRSAMAGQMAQAIPLVIAAVALWAWFSIVGVRFLFIACALALLVGRNTMLSTRRNLYVDIAIVLALFYDAIGLRRGTVVAVLDVAFLAALIFVLMADYADRRLSHADVSGAELRRAVLPGLGNAVLSTMLVLALAAVFYLLLPKPESIGLGFSAPDATTLSGGSDRLEGGGRGLGEVATASGGRSGPQIPAQVVRRMALGGTPGDGARTGRGGGGRYHAEVDAGESGNASTEDDAFGGGLLVRIGVPLVIATVDAPLPHYARTAVYSVAGVSAWSEPVVRPVTRFGDGSFDLRQQGLEGPGLVQTWTVKGGIGRNIPHAFQPVHLQMSATAVDSGEGQVLMAQSELRRGTRYRVVSSIQFADGRPAGVAARSPGVGWDGLPAGFERVRELASEIAAGQPDAQARAKAIEFWLRRNLAHGRFDNDVDHPVDAFLFERHAGGSVQFAAALASLLRAAGIESRIVEGFRVRRFNPLRGEFEVWEADRHVWVEAWFNARWWTFDAAPWARIPGDSPLPDAWNSALDYVRLARHDDFGVALPEGRRPAAWYLALVLAWGWGVTFGPWLVLAAVGTIMLLWFGRRLLRPLLDEGDLLRLRFAGSGAQGRVLAAYDVVERVFSRRGLPRAPEENHVEYLARLQRAAPVLEARLATLGVCFSIARYGAGKDPGMDRRATVACREIVRRVDERVS